jgi:hypothetical protein
MSELYKLENGVPVRCESTIEWGQWIENKENRRIAYAEKDGVKVSTVFLGVDHGFGTEKGVLFETMIFGGDNDGYQGRYQTLTEAKAGHERAMVLAFGEVKEEK